MTIEQYTVGPEKISMTVVRKTKGDLIVSQFSSERWFETEHQADAALSRVLRVFTDGNKFYALQETPRNG